MYRLAIKTYYSIQHLKSSYLLIEESKKIEFSDFSELEGVEKAELSSRNLAFVTGAIFSIFRTRYHSGGNGGNFLKNTVISMFVSADC